MSNELKADIVTAILRMQIDEKEIIIFEINAYLSKSHYSSKRIYLKRYYTTWCVLGNTVKIGKVVANNVDSLITEPYYKGLRATVKTVVYSKAIRQFNKMRAALLTGKIKFINKD